MTQSDDTNYDATRDPRTGRPLRPIEAEALREKHNAGRDETEAEGEASHSDDAASETLKKLWGNNLPDKDNSD
jgi:hypothetical protein